MFNLKKTNFDLENRIKFELTFNNEVLLTTEVHSKTDVLPDFKSMLGDYAQITDSEILKYSKQREESHKKMIELDKNIDTRLEMMKEISGKM